MECRTIVGEEGVELEVDLSVQSSDIDIEQMSFIDKPHIRHELLIHR